MPDTPLISYTDRDYLTIKEACRAHIQMKYPDTWKNFYESGLGMAWIELLAYQFDVLSFYLDYQANESYLPTARDRESIVNLCKLIGYGLRPATSAGVSCTASIATIQAADVIVLANTQVTTTGGVVFTFLENQRIPAGALEADVVCTEGTIITDAFVSTGVAFQRLRLLTPEVISGSITVTVNAEEWTQVDSVVYGDEASQYYSIEHDAEDYGYVQFGDGTSSAIPPTGAAIVVQYRVGGGTQGNIALSEINTTVQGWLDGSVPPTYVTVSLLNDEERGSGGEPRETSDHARFWAPLWVRTNGRAVTLDDFNVLGNAFVSEIYGSPTYVSAKLKQEIPELNTVELYVWARDSYGVITSPSTGLKAALEAYFNNNDEGAVRIICTDVEVLDGYIVYVDLALSIEVASNYAVVDTTSNVGQAITDFFNSSDVRPGWDLHLSRLYDTIQGVTGVSHALISEITASYKTTETIGVGDGATALYIDTLDLISGQPIVPLSVTITAGAQVVTDDGGGALIGDINPAGTNTIDYDTGDIDFTFAANVGNLVNVNCEFRYVLSYQRGAVEQTSTGVARIRGALPYPPLVPGTIAFTDGGQTVLDDGNGNLAGNIDGAGNNVIDYDTGAYDFMFTLPPAVGVTIYSTYRQLLRTPSEDIPIDRHQLAVRGLVTIATN